ncbi:hypothetical protein AAG570_001671, partial [Ranatra chinensis]
SPCGGPPSEIGGCSFASLLHPNDARVGRRTSAPSGGVPAQAQQQQASSTASSSMTSVAGGGCSGRSSPWGGAPPWRHRRSSSSVTATRYSLLDALDLEYALLRAATRGSVGPYSLSESLHKLTFTQSLAFPALARGLAAAKRGGWRARPGPSYASSGGLNAFARVVTAFVLVLVSVMVFGVVYKFVRT